MARDRAMERYDWLFPEYGYARHKGYPTAAHREACRRLGLAEDRIDVVRVPGALEIPLAAAAMAKSGRYIALACLGAILRGETDHHDHVASVATKGIGEITYQELREHFGREIADVVMEVTDDKTLPKAFK